MPQRTSVGPGAMARAAVVLSTLLCAGAAKNDLPSGESTQVVQFGSRQSDVVVHNHGSPEGAPLVVVLHGWFGGASGFGSLCEGAKISHWAKEYGFIGVCPDGNGAGNFRLFKSWNAKGCCGEAVTKDIDDVGFIREVVKHVRVRARVTKVYALGQSNGAMLSWRLMCEAADIFDGFAPVAGGFFAERTSRSEGEEYFQVAKSVTVPDGWQTTNDECGRRGPDFPLTFNNSNATAGKSDSCWHAHSYSCQKPPLSSPLLYVHGAKDTQEPYALDVSQWRDYGTKVLGCRSEVEKKVIGKATCFEMEGCQGGKTAFCSVADLGHSMPSEQKHGFDAVQAAWLYWHGKFF